MGCTQSKIENEETVNRCKERKQYMERAVTARNKFASAHAAHAMSLKNTGAALSDYAHGKVIYPAGGGGGGAGDATLPPPLPPYDNFPLPPPPPLPHPPLPPSYSPTSSPLQRASTVPELRTELKNSNTIIQEENEEDIDNESTHNLKHRTSKSSGRGSGGARGRLSHKEATEDEVLQKPPSPMRPNEREREHPVPPPPPPPLNKETWDYFFSADVPRSTLADVEDDQYNIDEIQRKVRDERNKKSEIDGEADGGRKVEHVKAATEVVERTVDLPPHAPPAQAAVATKLAKRVKMGASSEGKTKGGPSYTNLLQIFLDLDDCFLKAYESAHEVSRLLEATRLHYHSNFADKRGHIDHSTRVMRVITWNRSFKGLSADNGVDDFDSEEHETHATVLDKMLAWEKKLYDEVKVCTSIFLFNVSYIPDGSLEIFFFIIPLL
ncbi:nitrate regulatory gene2 protein-like [Olea europaea var. sylvestris]|uniref:nitrate regulatory gene2 protein-like n=1 Tax=Olea europaea var. sylvestris TaxID=158386 RepID=UPI000C1D7551|nr:nitrate regulatory gene2 protein-like [Olea europaea var. sylvestris]